EQPAVAACQLERVLAELARGHVEVGTLVLQRERDGAAARADLEDAGGAWEREGKLNEKLCLGAWHERPAIDGELQVAKAALADYVGDRLALDGTPANRVLEGAHRRTLHAQLAVEQEPLAVDPEHVREKHFGVEPRRLTGRRRD